MFKRLTRAPPNTDVVESACFDLGWIEHVAPIKQDGVAQQAAYESQIQLRKLFPIGQYHKSVRILGRFIRAADERDLTLRQQRTGVVHRRWIIGNDPATLLDELEHDLDGRGLANVIGPAFE